MKKSALSLLVIGVIALCSCGFQPSVKGDSLINKAREKYKNLDSAKVVMTNMDTNEVEQTFVFKYDEKGLLSFAYEGKNGDDVYAQYNNGVENFSYEKGKYEYSQKGDEKFVAYTKDVPHPQADEGLIVFQPSAVKKATVKKEDGVTHVRHEYDVDELGVAKNTKAFTADYYFDNKDNLLYFVESSTIVNDGKKQKYVYKVEITDKNKVDKVENTVEKYKD